MAAFSNALSSRSLSVPASRPLSRRPGRSVALTASRLATSARRCSSAFARARPSPPSGMMGDASASAVTGPQILGCPSTSRNTSIQDAAGVWGSEITGKPLPASGYRMQPPGFYRTRAATATRGLRVLRW